MRLIFKQRFFSFLDSYDIYDEHGNAVFTVKGQFSFGRHFIIYSPEGRELGEIRQELFTFRPKYNLYSAESYIGCITKEFTFFKPSFNIDLNGWRIEGDFFEWDYSIKDSRGMVIASARKEPFNFTDTYVIDVWNPADALAALMVVVAIDAEKASRN